MGGAEIRSDRPMGGGERSESRGDEGRGVRGDEGFGVRDRDDRFRIGDRDDHFRFGDRDDFLFAPRGDWDDWGLGAPALDFGLGVGPVWPDYGPFYDSGSAWPFFYGQWGVGPGFDRDDWRAHPFRDRDDLRLRAGERSERH